MYVLHYSHKQEHIYTDNKVDYDLVLLTSLVTATLSGVAYREGSGLTSAVLIYTVKPLRTGLLRERPRP